MQGISRRFAGKCYENCGEVILKLLRSHFVRPLFLRVKGGQIRGGIYCTLPIDRHVDLVVGGLLFEGGREYLDRVELWEVNNTLVGF